MGTKRWVAYVNLTGHRGFRKVQNAAPVKRVEFGHTQEETEKLIAEAKANADAQKHIREDYLRR